MAADEPFEFAAADGNRLRGALTFPASGRPAPAALLLNGSGPLDRDSNMPGQQLDVANALAAALADHGVASLRFDKRGVGESEGDYLTMGFEEETADARAGLEAVRAQPGVDAERVVVIGHSVGATIAMRLASADRRLAGIVLLAGPSRPGAEVMERQSERIAESFSGVSRLFSRPFLWNQRRTRRRLLASTEDVVRVGSEKMPARWLREFMAFDPSADLKRIECPVLAITGEKDLQVEAADVAEIGRLVGGPFTGSKPANLTHVLRTDDGPPSLAGYRAQLEKPIDATLVEQVVAWSAARLDAR